jgi:cell division protein FtsI (penicillin-binding protein 3)
MAGLTERRIGLLFAIFLGLLVLAAGRTLWLGGVRAEALQRAATTQQVDEIEIPARRGAISDRTGIELAVSEPAADVAATPYLVKRPLRAAARLAPLLGSTERKVLTKLSSESGFVYLARNLPASKAERIKKLKIDGLQFIPSSRRNYPAKSLASQVLGGVGVDGEGQGGLEYRFDDVLRGTDGTRRIVKDALGDPIVLQETERAVAGKDLGLTLDAQLQGKVEDVLAEVGAKWRPKGATAVVMDPRTSKVLALANWPRVDANDFGSAPAYAGQNRAVGFNYEPGSTFKAFTVAAALEDKVVRPDDVFSLPPSITVADRTIEEAHERGGIDLTVSQILAQSSNVGTVKIGLKIGPDRFDHWVRRFGFGRPTGVELPGEERGQVLRRKQYSGSSMGNLPIGQGESVTPMQLTAAYAAIANDGVLRRPRIVASIGDRRTDAPAGRRVISPRTAEQLRTMLSGVVEAGGTGAAAAIDGYTLAGKTGTANKIESSTGEYSKTRYIASFAGFAPARDPKLLVTVMVDEPQGEIFGASVAAPAFQEIMRFALPYLRIAPG